MNKTTVSYILSLFRIIAGAAILFIPSKSHFFIIPFLVVGILDGIVEKLMVLDSSQYGRDKQISSIATLVFVAAGSYKLIPELVLFTAIYGWLILIGVLILWNLLSEYFLYGKLIYVESPATRYVKWMLYLFPLLTTFFEKEFIVLCICVISTFAEMQLGHNIRMKSFDKEVVSEKN